MARNTKKILGDVINWTEGQTKVDVRYILKGGFWLTLGQIGASTLSFIAVIAFANLVSPTTFGTYKYIISVFGLLSVTTLGGVATSYMQAVARGYEGAFYDALKTRMAWGLFGTLGALCLSGYYFLQDNQTLALSFLLASIFVPFYETFGMYKVLLTGRKKFKKSTLFFLISRFLSYPILIGTIFLTDNLFLILLAYFIPLTLIQFILEQYVTKKFPPNARDDSKVLPYGKHISFVGFLGSSTRYFDSLLLFTTISAPALAGYALALAPVEQLAALYKGLIALIVPKLSKKDGREIHTTFWRRLLLMTLLSGILSVLYVFLIPFLFKLVFPLYTEYIFYAQLLGIVLFLSLPVAFLQGVTQARLDVTPKKLLYWRIAPRIIFLVSLFIFVPLYGIIGAIASRALLSLTMIVVLILQYVILIDYVRNDDHS